MSRSLLLIACSQRKAAGQAALPAWDLYDGVIYRVLKKRLGPQREWSGWLDVVIVSAKYGVIRPGRRIRPYDQIMPVNGNVGRWTGRLRRLVAGRAYHFVHINLGRAYQRAVGDVPGLFPAADVTVAAGGIGRRASQTAEWVEARIAPRLTAGRASPPSRSRRPPVRTRRRNGR